MFQGWSSSSTCSGPADSSTTLSSNVGVCGTSGSQGSNGLSFSNMTVCAISSAASVSVSLVVVLVLFVAVSSQAWYF